MRNVINETLGKMIINEGIARYSKNKYLEYLQEFNKRDFPIEMQPPAIMSRNVENGKVYRCFVVNEVEYIMVTDNVGYAHSISAYVKHENKRERVGALFYIIEQRNGNIAVKTYVVHKNYSRKGIGGNILLAMIRAEEKLLRVCNIYVHACPSGLHGLSQKELENHYEKYGLVLCNDCYAGAYNGKPPKEYVRQNLESQRKIALKI